MGSTWTIRPARELESLESGPTVTFETTPSRLEGVSPPWALFVGADEASLARGAWRWIGAHAARDQDLEILLPPEDVTLPLVVGRLRPPAKRKPTRVVLVHRLDRAFHDTLRGNVAFGLTSPLYLLPKLSRAANRDEPVSLVATALETELTRRGPEVLSGRGMAARFEIHRETGAAGAPGEASSPSAEVFDRLVREGASIERFLELGLATGEPALRERAYRHALSIAPESALSHLCLASAFSEQGKGREGIAELRNAIELEPELDVAHYELGKGLIRTDDLAGAAAAFRRTVELLPEYAPAWSNLGAALGELGDLPGAVEALTQAVAHDRFSHVLHNNLGVTYRNLGRLEEAESEFELVLRLAPDFVFGQYNLAHTHYLQGRYPKAVATFEKAQGMDPSRSPRQSLLLAVTRLASGDTEGAERDYREVFGRLSGQPKKDMLTVAEWDLRQVARDRKGDATLKRALVLIRGLA